ARLRPASSLSRRRAPPRPPLFPYTTLFRSPDRPTLEVDALLRPGDADAESGPLLLSIADYIPMAGGVAAAAPHLTALEAKGRIIEHLGVAHISFPTWTTVELHETG